MAAKRKKRKNSYSNDGFDMKSLAALIVIIVGVALIIVLVKNAEGNNTQEAGSGNPSASVNSDIINEDSGYVETEPENVTSQPENEVSEPEKPSFTVTVEDLEGTYNRTNVETANGAKLKVTYMDKEGFDFSLSLPEDNYGGYAVFVGETAAEWTYDGKTMRFECGKGSITVSGFKAANGKYITGEPTYTDEPESEYDASIVSSSATRSTLSGIMKGDDYSLFKLIMSDGSAMGISSGSSEYQTDKNGVGVMVDKQTGMMKYQYELKYEGRCMILCSSDGKVCIGIHNENDDTGELRYYASTSALRSDVPTCIRNYASAYGLELVVC